jgi:hypothetical protein
VKYVEGVVTRRGFLANVKPTTHIDQTTNVEFAAVFLYFVDNCGKWFKAKHLYTPYFYILCSDSVIK